MNTIKNAKLFTEVTVEESATVSGGDSLVQQTISYVSNTTDGVQIAQSTSASTPTNSPTSQPTQQNSSSSSQPSPSTPGFTILGFGILLQVVKK